MYKAILKFADGTIEKIFQKDDESSIVFRHRMHVVARFLNAEVDISLIPCL